MYYGILIICVLLVCIGHKHIKGGIALICFNIAALVLLLVDGLRDPFIYPDNEIYYEYFKGDHLANGEGTINFGYNLLNVSLNVFTYKFFIFSFVVALIINWGYVKFIKTYSPYMGLSLILYIMINYLPSFFLLRQYLAMPFVFLSIKYVIERKQKMFLLCILLAFSMHSMSICVIPLYYLYSFKYNKRDIFVLLVISIVACMSFMIIGRILVSFMPTYVDYMEQGEGTPAWTRAMTKIYIMIIFLLTLKKDCFKEGINKVVFLSMVMSVIICVGAANLFGVYRLRDFYSLADFIGIPLIFYYLKSRRVAFKNVVFMHNFICYFLVFLIFKVCRRRKYWECLSILLGR